MASFTKINDFVIDLAHEIHDLETDQLVVALSNTAPGAETDNPSEDGNGVLANVTEIGYGNLDGATPRNLTTSSSALSSGTYQLTIADLTLTANGGSVGPFRYVYIYNDDAPADELICYYDYGSSITLADGETLDLDFDGSNGLFQLS